MAASINACVLEQSNLSKLVNSLNEQGITIDLPPEIDHETSVQLEEIFEEPELFKFGVCCICFEDIESNPFQTAMGFINCKHRCICVNCQLHIVDKKCPICRTPGPTFGYCKKIPVIGFNPRAITAFNTGQPNQEVLPKPPSLQRQITVSSNYVESTSSNTKFIPLDYKKKPKLTIHEESEESEESEEEKPLIKIDHGINENKGLIQITSNCDISEITPPRIYIIIVDDSGSMGSEAHEIKENLKCFLSKLQPNDFISIIYFSDYASQLCALQEASLENKNRISSILDKTSLGGGTDFITAFKSCNKILSEACDNEDFIFDISNIHILFMSDGEPQEPCTIDTECVREMYRILDSSEKPYDVYTISFGLHAKAQNMLNILQLDKQSNYFHATTPVQFEEILDSIGMISPNICGTNVILSFDGITLSNSGVNGNQLALGTICDGNKTYIAFAKVATDITITLTYTNQHGNIIIIESKEILMPSNIIDIVYNYRKTLRELTNIFYQETIPKDDKIRIIQDIIDSATDELYGFYKDEIISESTKILLSYTASSNEVIQNEATQYIVQSNGFGTPTQLMRAQSVQVSCSLSQSVDAE